MPPKRLCCVLMATHIAQLLLLLCLFEQIRPHHGSTKGSRARATRSLRLWHTTNLGRAPLSESLRRVSVPACQRAPRREGQTSGSAEEDLFSDITRGHPYHFGGRSSQSPESLPHRTHPCQGAATTGSVSRARSRAASFAPVSPGHQRSFRTFSKNPIIVPLPDHYVK